MSTIKIVLEIPENILKGLGNGSYVRDAAGIIRWAPGTSKAGEIVCHLKELGEYQLAEGLLFPMGVMLATQAAGFLFLGYQLDKVHEAIEELRNDLIKVKDIVELIQQEIWLSQLKRVNHGIEYLIEGCIEDAQKAFREGRSDISLFLSHHQPSTLVEYLPQTEELLKGLCISFAGEYICMQKQKSETARTFQRYHEIFEKTEQKLSQFPASNRVIPTTNQLKHINRITPLKNKIKKTTQWISSEEEFAKGIRKIDKNDIQQLINNDTQHDFHHKLILEFS